MEERYAFWLPPFAEVSSALNLFSSSVWSIFFCRVPSLQLSVFFLGLLPENCSGLGEIAVVFFNFC